MVAAEAMDSTCRRRPPERGVPADAAASNFSRRGQAQPPSPLQPAEASTSTYLVGTEIPTSTPGRFIEFARASTVDMFPKEVRVRAEPNLQRWVFSPSSCI